MHYTFTIKNRLMILKKRDANNTSLKSIESLNKNNISLKKLGRTSSLRMIPRWKWDQNQVLPWKDLHLKEINK